VVSAGAHAVPPALAAAAGILADRVLGEPPARVHPVRAFGNVMIGVERVVYADARANGVVHAALGTVLGVGSGFVVDPAVATYVAVAGRELEAVASSIGDALRTGDLRRARALLPSLVGRDVETLDAAGMARAVVESVAENTVDAVVAPAWWAAVAGAPGALGCRAVNTLDAMVGHRSARYAQFGWASARLDDAVAFVPARLTAALVAAVRPTRARQVWRAVRFQAPSHPSPNAGVAEAAFATALGLRLGGDLRYGARLEHRPQLGTGRTPDASDIPESVRLSRHVCLALAGALATLGAAQIRRRRVRGTS
jgi:adenosylcobinamide-phosphate synthase